VTSVRTPAMDVLHDSQASCAALVNGMSVSAQRMDVCCIYY